MVRRFDLERALSNRRQKDDGLRVGGTVRLGIAGRNHLSDWWWNRIDRHVESIRRDGTDGLDRIETTANGHGTGFRLCADCPRIRGRETFRTVQYRQRREVCREFLMTMLLLKGRLPRKSRRDAMFIEKSISLSGYPIYGRQKIGCAPKGALHFQMDLLVL